MFFCAIFCVFAVFLSSTPCFAGDDFFKPVQPSWAMRANSTLNSNFKVHASVKSLKEVQRLRDEIQDKIEEDRYVVGRANESAIIKMVDKALGEPFRIAQHTSQLLGAAFDDDDDDFSRIFYNTVESAYAVENADDYVGEENEFESLFERYMSYSNRNREKLRVDYIVEDPTLKFGENVIEWRSFYRLDRKLLIGRERNSLLCFEFIDGSWILTQERLVNSTAFETLDFWNETREELEGVIAIAALHKIFWLDVNSFQILWTWEVEEPVTALRALEVDDINYIAAVHSSSGVTYITVHQFDLVKKEAVHLQTIPLDTHCDEMVFLDVGSESALAVPQTDSVVIFTLMLPHDSTIRVIRVMSKGVNTISGFHMEGISYLGIAGEDPQILQYHEGLFVPQTILSASFGFVNFFLAVPAGTYRDDLVLLVQHQINYDSHFLSVVEPLVWNGEAFESTPSVPCKIGEVELKHGVSCLMDPDREEGIKGAAVFSLEGKTRLIIPREAEPSGYFTCFMELVVEKKEEELLAMIFDHFKQVGQYIEETQSEAENFLERSSNTELSEPPPLVVDELFFDGTVDEIFVNGEKLTEADFEIDMDRLLDEMEDLTKELFEFEESQKAEIPPSEPSIQKREVGDNMVEAHNVNVTHLFVEQINGVPVEDVIFVKNNEIHHNGPIIFEHAVTVSDAINATHFSQLRATEEALNFENIVVNGDVRILKINGEPWEELLQSTVLLNERWEIDELLVNGEVTFSEELEIESLNSDKFPEQFLLSIGPAQSIVTGEKRFLRELYVRSVDCEGTIQDVNPFDLITLDDEQVVPGWTTFHQIKVTESLEIRGTISGEYMEDFLPNPTLLHMKHVKSACFFKHLEVLGPVYVEGYFNGIDLSFVFQDVLYKTENDVEINSLKSFESISVANNILLTSNLINDIRLDDFVTRSGDQEIYITDLNGNVQVNNLELSGLFDFVNITELDHSAVKRFGEQYINSELIFEESYGIMAERVKIMKTLNQVAAEKYVTIDDPQSVIEFESIEFLEDPDIRSLTVAENGILTGNGVLNDIDLKELDATRISASKSNQVLTSEASIGTAYVESNINAQKINGFDADLLLKVLADFNDIPRYIETGELIVPELAVRGNISLDTINDRQFDQIVENVVWLNRENTINADIEFLDPVFVEDTLEVGDLLNERNFDQFVESLVLKDDPNPIITGVKRFKKTIQVNNDLKVMAINQIPYDAIAKRNAPLNIDGTVVIRGDLTVENLKFDGFFNDFPVEGLNGLDYEYDASTETHVLKNAEVLFSQPVEIDHLKIEGSLNDIENFQALIDSIIYINTPAFITGKKTFVKKIIFQNEVEIDYFNGLDLRNFLDNVVYKNESEPVTISGSVVFKGPVSGAYAIAEGGVYTTNLMGCSLKEWVENGLRTDMNLTIPGRVTFFPGSLDGNSILVDYLNGVAVSDIVTLHTEQHLDGFYQFTEMYLKDSMVVEGQFCGVDVAQEYENTVLDFGNQTVECETTFQQVRVLNKLETLGPINGKDLRQLIDINTDLEIRSPMYFRSVNVGSLHTNDSVSGFDFEDWARNALWSCGREEQEVTGNWEVDTLDVKGSVQGNGLINGLLVEQIQNQFEEIDLEGINNLFKDSYRNACMELQTTLQAWNNRSFSVDYTDWAFDLTLDGPIAVFLVFPYQNSKFIIANTGCNSTVLKWDTRSDVLDVLTTVETGYLRQIVAIPGEDNELFLVTSIRSENSGCRNEVSKVWTFDGRDMIYSDTLNKSNGFTNMIFRRDSPGTMYAIDKTSKTLVEMKLKSREQRSWDLSGYEPEQLQFIPAEANLGLALTGRRQVFIINSDVKQSHRFRRSLLIPFPDVALSSQPGRCFSRVEAGGEIESQTMLDESDIEKYAQECILRERIAKLNPKPEPPAPPEELSISDNAESSCNDCYAPRVQHVVNGIVGGLVSDLESVKSPSGPYDPQLSEARQNTDYYDGEDYDKTPFEYDHETASGNEEEAKRRLFEHLHDMEKTMKVLTTPARIAINYDKLKRFSKKVTAKLYHGFNEVREIHKAIDRVRGKGDLYVSQPFHKQLVHESLSAPNKHEYQIERPTLHVMTEILNILNNGRKNIEFTIHDFPLNDVQADEVGAGSDHTGSDWVADKFRNVEEEIQKIVTQLLEKSNELAEAERIEKEQGGSNQTENSVDSQLDRDSENSSISEDRIREEQELGSPKDENSGVAGKANVTTVSFLREMITVTREEIELSERMTSSNKDESTQDTSLGKNAGVTKIIEGNVASAFSPESHTDLPKSTSAYGEQYGSEEPSSDLRESEQVTTESSLRFTTNTLPQELQIKVSTDSASINGNHLQAGPQDQLLNKQTSDNSDNSSTNQTLDRISPRPEAKSAISSVSTDRSDLPSVDDSTAMASAGATTDTISLGEHNTTLDSVFPAPTDPSTKDESLVADSPSDLGDSQTSLDTGSVDFVRNSSAETTKLGEESEMEELSGEQDDSSSLSDTISSRRDSTTHDSTSVEEDSEMGSLTPIKKEGETIGETEVVLGVPKSPLEKNEVALEDAEEEPLISKPITADDYLVADISHLPSLDSGEIVVIEVGPERNRQMFIVVTELRDHMANNGHDAVRIYYDIHEGSLFQTISATRPRNLVAVQWRDETVLGYVEGDYTIKLYMYRGVGGFVPLSEVHSDTFITSLSPSSVGAQNDHGECPKQYIIAAIGDKLSFHEIVMSGNCFQTSVVKCYN